MTPVPALSEASKSRLSRASDRLCDLLDDGEPIEKAAALSAIEHGVPTAHLPLLCNAANVAAMEATRQTADTTLAKAAQVEVARPENVAKLMLELNRPQDRRKSASEPDRYSAWLPPTWLDSRDRPPTVTYTSVVSKTEKPGSNRIEFTRKVASLLEEFNTASHRAVSGFQKAAKALASRLIRREGATFADLNRDGPAVFGKEAAVVLQWLEPELPAAIKREPARYASVNSEPFLLLKTAIDRLADVRKLANAETQLNRAQQQVELWNKFEQEMDEPRLQGADILFGIKKAVGFGDLLKLEGVKSIVDAGVKTKDPLKESPDIQDETAALEHEASLRNIRVAAELGSLLSTDEVIRRFEPREVIDHYNELARTAPTALLDKATMRALLRQRLEAGKQVVNPYEIDLLRKIDKSYGTNPNLVLDNVAV